MPVQEKILQIEKENQSLIKIFNKMKAYSPTTLYEDEDIDVLLNLLLPKDKVFISSVLPFDLSQMNKNALIDLIMNSYLEADTRPIVIPINILSKQKTNHSQQAYMGMHWIAAIVYPQKGNSPAKIAIFDPFGNGCGQDINLTYKGNKSPATARLIELGQFLKDALNSFGVKTDDSKVHIFNDAIQKNSVDCGPIVVESTRRIIGAEQRLVPKQVSLLREEQLNCIEERIAINQRLLKVLQAGGMSNTNPLTRVGFYRAENSVVSSCQENSAKVNSFRK